MTSVKYHSTRGGQGKLGFEDVVMTGLGEDKGLFVPEYIPKFSLEEIEQMRHLSFDEVAEAVITRFVKDDEIPELDLRNILTRSFEQFRAPDVTPSVRLKDFWVLELFHGPTFAFKDVALQFLGNLFEYFLNRGRKQRKLTILGATSGDTGSAAIHGLRGKSNINCFILYPHGKVTDIQERQMTTVMDRNVHCICIRGDFDDAQALVKEAFNDHQFRDRVHLGAVNSINWARILAQITYYFYSWFRVTDGLRSHGEKNPSVNYSVPTGNFGDILAGWYAKQMGLPIGKLVIATNENNVLHRFLSTGTYERQPTRPTLAPSMDISISSNLERYLFYLAKEDTTLLQSWMQEFEINGSVTLPEAVMASARADFLSASASKSDILSTMKAVYLQNTYLVCPHTATAVHAVYQHKLDAASTVVLATAHAAKFEDAILLCLSHHVLPPRPELLMELYDLPVRKTLLPPALDDIELFIKQKLVDEESSTTQQLFALAGSAGGKYFHSSHHNSASAAAQTPRRRRSTSSTGSAASASSSADSSPLYFWTSLAVVTAMAAGAAFYMWKRQQLSRR